MTNEEFNIFDDRGWGIPADLDELFDMARQQVQQHGADIHEVIGVFIDMIRPGTSENSHDIKPIFTGAMYVQGYGLIADQFRAMYLNSMPWGIGFCIAVEEGFEFTTLNKEQQRAVITSLAAVLQAGGMVCSVTDDNTIRLVGPGGQHSDYTAEELVGQFRTSMDEELGPDAPGREDPTKRWIPREEDE